MDAPVEAVIWDYGGVISSPLFRGIGGFEADMGYPPGSILELIFGETAYIGAEGNPRGGDPVDGAVPESASAVTHDWHRLETGEIGFEEYMAGVMERAPQVLGRSLDIDAYQQFTRDMPLGIHWPVVHRIRRLRDDGVKVALLTNNVKEFGSAWRSTFPVDELFEVVVDSSEVGMRKPDPAIFALALRELGDIVPEHAVFLDDFPGNIAAARRLGMHGVLVEADPTSALAELERLVG